MNIIVLLADYAQGSPGEKFSALGLGWSKTSTPLGIHSLVLLVDPDEEDLEGEYHLDLRLLDEAGNIVEDPSGNKIGAAGELRIAANSSRSGIRGVSPLVIALGPGLPLKPGAYRWEVTSPSFPGRSWSRQFEVQERGSLDAEQ
jgi:hypothetical protein